MREDDLQHVYVFVLLSRHFSAVACVYSIAAFETHSLYTVDHFRVCKQDFDNPNAQGGLLGFTIHMAYVKLQTLVNATRTAKDSFLGKNRPRLPAHFGRRKITLSSLRILQRQPSSRRQLRQLDLPCFQNKGERVPLHRARIQGRGRFLDDICRGSPSNQWLEIGGERVPERVIR